MFALQPVNTEEHQLPEDIQYGWSFLLAIRSAFTRMLEPLRQNKTIGLSLDTALTLYLSQADQEMLARLNADLREFFIVSQVQIRDLADAPGDAVTDPALSGAAIRIEKAAGVKCARCWMYSEEIGQNPDFPDVCPRCSSVLMELNAE